MKGSRPSNLLPATAILAGLALPAYAESPAPAADTAQGGGLEEIVVTAERRTEKLRDVPIAVTSFNAANLQQRNITDIRGIAGFAPNVSIVQSPAFQTVTDIAIRGGVTINPGPYWDPTVGLYIDGVYIPKAVGNVTDMADIDHMEILRGPQGTLYGRNSLGGALNIVTQKPTGRLEGYLTLGAGDYGSTQARGVLNLPALGIFSVQLSGVMQGHDGYIDAVSDPYHSPLASPSWLGKMNSVDSRAGRIAVRAAVMDDFTIDYAFDVSYQTDTSNYSQLSYSALPFLQPYIQHQPGPSAGATIDASGAAPFEVAHVRAHALTMGWDISEALTLKSISALRWIDWSANVDLDGTPIDIAATALYHHYHSASQELQATGQIDRFHYTAGLFYFDDGGYTYNPQAFFRAFGPSGVVYDSQYGYGTQTFAGYFQVDYNPPILDDRLTLTVGLRYSNETKYGSRYETLTTGQPATTFVTIPRIAVTKNFDDATPMFIAKYAIDDAVNVYAKYAEGFKSGGFNGEAATLSESIVPFRPETVSEYEIGVKTRWLDGKLNLNLAGFYDRHSDLQLSVFVGTGSAATVIRNAGSADISGLEFEVQALPVSWLSLTGSVGYLNTAYNTFIDGGVNVADDRAFPYAPQFTASLSADATLMDNDIGQLHLIVDYRHSDAYYEYPFSFDPRSDYYAGATKASPQNVVDARLRLTGIEAPQGTIDIELWGRNIFNDKYRMNGIPFPPSLVSITMSDYGDPPTFGGDVTYHFGKHDDAAAEALPYVPPPKVAAIP